MTRVSEAIGRVRALTSHNDEIRKLLAKRDALALAREALATVASDLVHAIADAKAVVRDTRVRRLGRERDQIIKHLAIPDPECVCEDLWQMDLRHRRGFEESCYYCGAHPPKYVKRERKRVEDHLRDRCDAIATEIHRLRHAASCDDDISAPVADVILVVKQVISEVGHQIDILADARDPTCVEDPSECIRTLARDGYSDREIAGALAAEFPKWAQASEPTAIANAGGRGAPAFETIFRDLLISRVKSWRKDRDIPAGKGGVAGTTPMPTRVAD